MFLDYIAIDFETANNAVLYDGETYCSFDENEPNKTCCSKPTVFLAEADFTLNWTARLGCWEKVEKSSVWDYNIWQGDFMSESKIELKSVNELLGMKFFIPSYQRGYRWTEQQVSDLLNDVYEFEPIDLPGSEEKTWYCLQPLVVKKMEETDSRLPAGNKNGWYEVIDGQQRLTTIFILLSFLCYDKAYSISYETRKNFKDFLNEIKKRDGIDNKNERFNNIIENKNDWNNIDFYHIFIAFVTIKEWFGSNNDNKEKYNKFRENLSKHVKFIWYETDEEDPIKAFTRLNIGKISLTNAELIKALFLNRSNFDSKDDAFLRLRQQEIASEWDNIEYTLQNDEFWLFLHEKEYDRPTRIDFIFDLICEQQSLGKFGNVGTDEYKTFRYFYAYFKQEENGKSKIETCWKEVKRHFQTFQEWFNDLELYHYVGYLITCNMYVHLKDLYCTYISKETKDKDDFVSALKGKIKDIINCCNDLNKQYEISGSPKTQCRPLLLLHNIQTIINQNKDFSNKKEYKLPAFYKFPFHLFKKEKWDVEHIDSNTTNGLENEKDQKEWLKCALLNENLGEETRQKIKIFLNDAEGRPSFDDLANKIENQSSEKDGWTNAEQDKNKIWNFVLLDANTNRGYGNAIFPAKRRCIIGKDQGAKYEIDENKNFEVTKKPGAIAFIPPVTRNVFLKYYNTSNANFKVWNRDDAEAYKKNILETLKEFGVTDSSNK